MCDKSGSKERDKSIPKVSVSLLLHLIPLLLLPTYPFFMPNCCEYIPQNIAFYFLLLIVATLFTAIFVYSTVNNKYLAIASTFFKFHN